MSGRLNEPHTRRFISRQGEVTHVVERPSLPWLGDRQRSPLRRRQVLSTRPVTDAEIRVVGRMFPAGQHAFGAQALDSASVRRPWHRNTSLSGQRRAVPSQDREMAQRVVGVRSVPGWNPRRTRAGPRTTDRLTTSDPSCSVLVTTPRPSPATRRQTNPVPAAGQRSPAPPRTPPGSPTTAATAR